LFYVDSDGTRLKGDIFSVGSGSTFAYGVLDQVSSNTTGITSQYQNSRSPLSISQGYRWDLTDEEAQELGRRSIVAAGHRDGYSGNTNNLYHVRENGWEFLGNMDISDLWYKYEEEKKQARKEKTEEVPVESMQVE